MSEYTQFNPKKKRISPGRGEGKGNRGLPFPSRYDK